jgi:hypothetical protein
MLRRCLRICLAAAILTVVWPRTGYAQCAQPNGNDSLPDDAAIQCLLDQGGTITLNADVTNGYYISSRLILRHSGTTLTSTSNWGYRALLIATSGLNARMIGVVALVTLASDRVFAELFPCLSEQSFCYSNGGYYFETYDCFWNEYTQQPECAYQCTYTWGAALGSCRFP